MKKQFLNLGKALSKNEQKQISGGIGGVCCEWCSDGTCSEYFYNGHFCSFAPKC